MKNHDPDIGHRLALARKAAGYSQSEAATLIGVHLTTLMRMERTGRIPATVLRDALAVYQVAAETVLNEPTKGAP